MYKINCHHQIPHKSKIKIDFFFNSYKISNDFFEKEIFIRLPQVKKEFKIKNESEAYQSDSVICVRSSEKLSAHYTLPSIFIRKTDKDKCKTIINNFLKNEVYNKLPKRLENRVVDILDELKLRKVKVEKLRELIIDFILIIDKTQNIKYDHKRTIIMLENLNEIKITPNELIDLYLEKYSKISITKTKKKEDEFIKLGKEKLKQTRKEIEINEKNEKEEASIKSSKFNVLKDEYIENSLVEFINVNNEYYNLFNKKAKVTIKKYFKLSLDLIIKNEDSLSQPEIINNHFKLFLFFNKEELDFLKNNNYLLQISNCENLQFEYNHIIDSLKNESNKELKKHKNQFNNFSRKKTIATNIGIKLLLKIKLNKKNHTIEDFKKINKETEKENIYKLFFQVVKNESMIKDDSYINKLCDDITDKEPVISIQLNDIKTYNEDITKALKNSKTWVFLNPNSSGNIKKYEVISSKELKIYKNIFPKARLRDREIIYYAGKTNSGKTYQAFEDLKKYNNGIYLAPLRLLAVEGQEEIEKRGFECSLLTGEERDIKNNARFISSTIEMLNTDEKYDVAIIDEIQMINDPNRGAAWLQALVGVNAKKVIILGSSEVKELVYNLSCYLDEPLTYNEFKRKSPLKMIEHIKENKKLEPNSAVIAFSKKELFRLKQKYEKLGNKVSILYGKLPPTVKIKESEKFRNGESDVLISTDVIGMGLNLPIKNIYFNEIEKYDGNCVSLLNPSLVKQIAGRAGRFGKFENGYVSSFSKYTNDYIESCLNKDMQIEATNFSTRINLPIFVELLKINKKRDVKEILKLSNHISFDITKITNINLYDEISEIINTYSDNLSNHEIVSLLNSPLNEDYNDIYINAFKIIFKTLIKNKDRILKEDDFDNLYAKIIKNINFNTKEKEYKLLDLIHFFTFNFKEFRNFEVKIRIYKSNASNEIMSNLINNINEDDLNYYCNY